MRNRNKRKATRIHATKDGIKFPTFTLVRNTCKDSSGANNIAGLKQLQDSSPDTFSTRARGKDRRTLKPFVCVVNMELNKSEGFKNGEESSNHINRLVLPRLLGKQREKSLTGSETFSVMTNTSSTNSPEIDSDLEDMALQEEEEDDEENAGEYQRKETDEESFKQTYKSFEKEIRQIAKASLKKRA